MVIVLLNPSIFKKKDGKGFNLRLNDNKTPLSSRQQQTGSSSEIEGGESVLEVGFAKDWGRCEAFRADGTICGDWVDTRHTKICAYHVDQGLKRARKGRMEYAVGYSLPPNLSLHFNMMLTSQIASLVTEEGEGRSKSICAKKRQCEELQKTEESL